MTMTTNASSRANQPLFDGAEWNFELIKRTYDAIAEIGVGEMGLDIYPNQIEVITAEQMLDSYASIGMPNMYRHWSFGKHYAREEALYRKGARALAYELVINSNPCINYIMEENTMTMQTLVMAHAAMGHNHFFKNNYLFRQWTDATSILDYLAFAKEYITECEQRFGAEKVELVLDSAHALMNQGVSRHPVSRMSATALRTKDVARREYEEATYNELWRTVPRSALPKVAADPESKEAQKESVQLGLPQENLLYFLEKHAPKLDDWQRELLRIVRMLAQYFYPQRQTKVMNEGCATWCHYEIMNRMYDRGMLTEGTMLEFMHSHSSVVFQPRFEDKFFSGFNPYALGFAMMRDIQRTVAGADRRGQGVVPRDRRQRRPGRQPEGGLGQLPRRQLHPAVPVAEGDPRFPPVPDSRQLGFAVRRGQGDPRRAGLPARAQDAGLAVRRLGA